MAAGNIDAVLNGVVGRLEEPGYKPKYPDETAFEVDVWHRLIALGADLGFECLTSHAVHSGRSAAKWEQFCSEPIGPDVRVLGANNRLDIVLKTVDVGSIGIEVKCLGANRHAGKLTQGLGQAVLGLANRDRTILLIHCGTISNAERAELRNVGKRVCNESRMRLVVVP